jgi:hypothetical protein
MPLLLLKQAFEFMKAIPWQVYAMLIAVVIFIYGWNARFDAGYQAATAEIMEAYAQSYLEDRKQLEKEFNEKAEQYIKERDDGLKQKDALIADLRSNAVSLRKKFQCPSRPANPTNPSGSDGGEEAGFTREDAEVAFGIAADGDAAIRQLSACQAILKDIQNVSEK